MANRLLNWWMPAAKAVFTTGLLVALMPLILHAQVKETMNAARDAAVSVGGLTAPELLALVAVASVAGLVVTQWMSNRAQMAVSDKIAAQTVLIAKVKEDTTILVGGRKSRGGGDDG